MNLSRLPSNGPVLSVVIPVFNEKPVLPRLYERLHKALDSLDFQYEIVFVDDGSTDDSHRYLAGLAYTYPWVRLVKLSRNFGKEAATTAGLDHALGHAVIIMDADLQDPPELIPLMVEAWRSGMDIVLMRRRSRNGEGALKRDPPPLNGSTLKYGFDHEGGPQWQTSDTSPTRSSRSFGRLRF
ncbi:MAG: glycosyltransferase family 2 protein, partial [Pseudomonadota bacterium]